MKTLSLFLIPFALLSPSLAVSQVNCTTFIGGEVTCTGLGGYQAQGRQYLGGVESWYDNRGATAAVRHGPFGSTSIDTTNSSAAVLINARPGPLLSSTKGVHTSEALRRSISSHTLPPASDTYGHGHSEPVPDKASLPKTPEEYRLSVLWMKAVSDKNFEKAETLKKLLWDEQFANASPVGRVEMFEKARVEERLEALAAMDRLEKRLRADGSPVKLANLIRFKEIARKSHAEEDAKLDEALKLLKQRAEADRTLAILDDELGRMLAEEGIQAKGKAK